MYKHEDFYSGSTSSTMSIEETTCSDNNENSFNYLLVESSISQTKFPVYRVSSMNSGAKDYAMKTFPFQNGKPSMFYLNEVRFQDLPPNDHVLVAQHHIDEDEMLINSKMTKVSYIIMEYATRGNFFNFIKNHANRLDEKLTRTYFRQLIEGLEFLHQNGVAHLDLKPENLLIGEDFNLKIADFDTSYKEGDMRVLAKGTKYKRAPELIVKKCINKPAADIFSAGIILFLMKTGGKLPQAEDTTYNGINLYTYMQKQNDKFWELHANMQQRDIKFFDKNFRDLFNSMTRENPEQRATIYQIKNSKWYNGEYYSKSELKYVMQDILDGNCDKFEKDDTALYRSKYCLDEEPSFLSNSQYDDNCYYDNGNICVEEWF